MKAKNSAPWIFHPFKEKRARVTIHVGNADPKGGKMIPSMGIQVRQLLL